jgi:predicted nucleic acid-binding protein
VSRLLYADTGALIALIHAGDDQHARVAAHFRRLRSLGDRLVTSEAVVAETVTRLRYDAGLPVVRRFRSVLERFADLAVSYTDAVGAVIARERQVDAVFGLDNDFRIMGFTLEP